MSNDTARTLTLVAGIFFVIEFMGKIVAAIYLWFFLPQLLALIAPTVDPATLAILTTIFGWLQTWIPLASLLASIPTIIVAILTLSWRNTPEEHKMGLITIGILGIIFLGSLPGLLALIAGILIKEK